MSEKFVASNGWELRSNGAMYSSSVAPLPLIGRPATEALEEMFRNKRDTELGRWRWPDNPNMVAYHCPEAGRVVLVLDEARGISQVFEESGMTEYVGDRARAAAAYFLAHPDPKPWHDAKPGEVWELNTDSVPGRVVAWSTFEGVFMDASQNWVTGVDIISGKRIWPEEGN